MNKHRALPAMTLSFGRGRPMFAKRAANDRTAAERDPQAAFEHSAARECQGDCC